MSQPPVTVDAAPMPPAKWRAGLMTCLKCAVAAFLLWWLVRTGRFDWRVLGGLRLSWPLAGVLFFQAGMLFCQAVRWHLLTAALNLGLPFSQTLRISLIGYYAAILTPASLGLDGARLLMSRKLRPGQNRAILASLLWDRVIGLWALLVVSVLCGLLSLNFQWLRQDAGASRIIGLATLACVALALLVVAAVAAPGLLARLPGSARVLAKFPSAGQAPPRGILGWPLLLGFGTITCNVLTTVCALRVFEPGASIAMVSGVTPFVVLSTLVPLTPLGLGVTDATAALLFAAIGVSHGAAATMVGRTLFVLLSLGCGLAWLWPIKSAGVEPDILVSS